MWKIRCMMHARKVLRNDANFTTTNKDILDPAPLSGIRVLDLTRIVAGPYCTMLLADLGAEVIKIERPGVGDEARHWGPPWANNSKESTYFLPLNRNKLSVAINIKTHDGQRIVSQLARKCDVLVENYVPGKLDQLALGYDDLQVIAPHLIYCSITGYGPKGPYSGKPGYDVIAASRGGLLHITGPENGAPVKPGVALTDIATGLYAHGAIMAALLQRNNSPTKQGQKIDVNLLSTQLACLINIGSSFLNAGQEGKRWGTAHPSIVPYQMFQTRDGFYTLGTGSDQQFRQFCALIDHPELSGIEEYRTNSNRVTNRTVLIDILSGIMAKRTNQEWERLFENATFPNGPVNTLEEVFNDRHVKEIGVVQEIQHSTAGNIKLVGPAVMYSKGGNTIRTPPPLLGQHTDHVLQTLLHFDDEDTIALKLKKPSGDRKVKWSSETVDNEHMDKKKSKCCCIYKKPRAFGESSSEDEDADCDHHDDHKKKSRSKKAGNAHDECLSGDAPAQSDN